MACVSTVRVILALCEHKLGNAREARSELSQGRELIARHAGAGVVAGDSSQGFWFDWILSEILEREAVAEIDGPAAGRP
jgi:hypothetical protein